MINDITPGLALPLPHPANDLADDVTRLRSALGVIDAELMDRASLVGGKVPSSQLPSFVDDVVEVETFAALPMVGEAGKIYVVLGGSGAANTIYRWGGSAYVEISPSPGSTDAVPEGALNKYFTAERARAAQNIATNSQLGVVKVGNGLSVDGDGLLSLNESLKSFANIVLPVTGNGQTSFFVAGGYTVGAIQVLLNGVELMSVGDYTALDGTTLHLTSGGITTADTLLVRRWATFALADAYTKEETDGLLANIDVIRRGYEDRGDLRAIDGIGKHAVVDGLGLFSWEVGSAEPDDDESCFATATGRWLLEAVHWDVVDAWQLPEIEERDAYDEDEPLRFASSFASSFASKVLTGSATCAITSVASVASTSFTGTVTGAAVGDQVIATPPAQLGSTAADTGCLSHHAWVSAANTVTIMLTNASASSANTNAAIRTAWPITVIKS